MYLSKDASHGHGDSATGEQERRRVTLHPVGQVHAKDPS